MNQRLPTRVVPIPAAARLVGIQHQTIRKCLREGLLEIPIEFVAGNFTKRYVGLRSLLARYGSEDQLEDIEDILTHSALIVTDKGTEYEILSDRPEVLEREVAHV